MAKMNRKTKLYCSFLVLFFVITTVFSGNGNAVNSPTLVFELPLLDLPYQFDAAKTVNGGTVTFGSFFRGYENPSMQLSLSTAADLYSGLHYGIGRLFNSNSLADYGFGKKLLFKITLGAVDLVTFWSPGFLGWEHEEFHRAVMSRFHVNSFNGMNNFPIGSNLVSVSRVRDEDLIRFKQESPPDFIRMQVAGSEGEYQLMERLRRNQFFYDQDLDNYGLYYLAVFNSIGYVKMCSIPSIADKSTDEANAEEKTIEARDFTGLDFLGWTYDLFRPNEPYADRGIHPSGVGINRYIKTTDLTGEEFSYLQKQGNLQLLNLISPSLIPSWVSDFDFNRILLSATGLTGTLAFHNYLTSFGNDICCTIFLRDQIHKFIFGIHSSQNYRNFFPSLEAQLIDWEKPLFSHILYISPRILVGVQPLNQGFRTSKSAFLGLAECKLELAPFSGSAISPFVELSAKSKGWVAGNEYLDRNFCFSCGIESRTCMR
jgi:hypothetical protein